MPFTRGSEPRQAKQCLRRIGTFSNTRKKSNDRCKIQGDDSPREQEECGSAGAGSHAENFTAVGNIVLPKVFALLLCISSVHICSPPSVGRALLTRLGGDRAVAKEDNNLSLRGSHVCTRNQLYFIQKINNLKAVS